MGEKSKKNSIILFGFIFLVIIGMLGTLFYANLANQTTTTAEATVTYVGNHYIVVEDDNGEEYSLTTDQEYQVGDKIRFTMKNIKKNSYPKEGTVEKIDTISKSVQFQIDDSKENTINQEHTESNSSAEGSSDGAGNSVSSSEVIPPNSNSDENGIVAYFEDLNQNLDAYNQDKSLGASVKSGFVTVVDFLFYGQPIKGKTFNELGTMAKLKVLKLALSIDKKIEQYFPGYKEEISATGSKIYTNVKAKVVETYLNITTKVCAEDPDTCAAAKEGLTDLKNSFSLTWNFIKEISGVGLSKLKAWYEVWRDC